MTVLKNYPYVYYYEQESGTVRGTWKFPDKEPEWVTVDSLSELRVIAAKVSPELVAAREKSKKHDREIPGLNDALDNYSTRMVTAKGRAIRDRGKKDAVRSLRKLFAAMGWKRFEDINQEEWEVYRASREAHPNSLLKEVNALRMFFKRHQRDGVTFPLWLHEVRVDIPEVENFHDAWSEEQRMSWWSYLTREMDLLIEADPTWSWNERIDRCCHTREFEQRMRILIPQMLQWRGLYRPGESRRVKVKDWNGRSCILRLSNYAKKVNIKFVLADTEASWLYNSACLRTHEDSPLGSLHGREWSESWLYAVTRKHLDIAGFKDKQPYDPKYSMATFIYEHPELFKNEDHEERLDRVRAVLGHEDESAATLRYIRTELGSEYGVPLRDFFNTQRLFPLDVTKYPVAVHVPLGRPRSLRAP